MLDKRTSGNGILWLFLADQFFNSIVQVLVLLLMWLHFKVASYLLFMLKMLFTIDLLITIIIKVGAEQLNIKMHKL